jgi:hypothetical protein
MPAASVRLARLLWIALAVVVWNVIFDRVIVVSGRQVVAEAGRAAPNGPFPNIDDYMRPAVTRGFWIATASGSAILVAGLAFVSRAKGRAR